MKSNKKKLMKKPPVKESSKPASKPAKKQKKSWDLSDLKGVRFTTPKGRLSFPNLHEPKAYQDKGEPQYSTTMLWPKNQDLKEMKKSIHMAAVEAFGKDKEQWPTNLQLPWRDGDDKSDYDGYEDSVYVANIKTKNRPVVCEYVDKDNQRQAVDNVKEEAYGGRNARLVVVAKATESGGKYYITLYLQAVQLLPGGEPFGSGVDLEKDFDDYEDDSDDMDNYDDEEVVDSEDEEDEDESDEEEDDEESDDEDEEEDYE